MLNLTVHDYVNIVLRVATVEQALAVIAATEGTRLAEFGLELQHALDLDHHRVSLAAITEVLGDLGDGDALRAIAEKLTCDDPGANATLSWSLDRWDAWALGLTGRVKRARVGRVALRNEIAASLVETPALRRERDALLDAVRAATEDERMTASEAVEWIRGLDQDSRAV